MKLSNYLEASFWPTMSANSGESLRGLVIPSPLGMIRLGLFFIKKEYCFYLDVEPIVIVGELI